MGANARAEIPRLRVGYSNCFSQAMKNKLIQEEIVR